MGGAPGTIQPAPAPPNGTLTMARPLRVYTFDDGRTEYAVATVTRKEALALLQCSDHAQREYGYVWDVDDEVPGVDVVFETPGTVFEHRINSDDPWVPVASSRPGP